MSSSSMRTVLFLILSLTLDSVVSTTFEGFGDEEEDVSVESFRSESVATVDHSVPVDLESLEIENSEKTKDIVHQRDSSWDAEEFEGFDIQKKDTPSEGIAMESQPSQRKSIWKKQESYKAELIGVVFIAIYLLNILWGKIQNEALALSWAQTFIAEGGVLEKNFSLLGYRDDGEMVTKESHSCFKFYASGRRYTQSMLVSLNLKARQDLFSLLLDAFLTKKDTIDFEVFLNEGDMAPMVCVLASPKDIKLLLRENEDIKIYAREIPVKQLPKWPKDKINVWTELPDLFYDLMIPEVKNVFLSPDFENIYGKYFRYIYISSDCTMGMNKKVIKFSFNLPSKTNMHELGRWISLIPLLIDLVAEYNPSQEVKKRAQKHRELESERMWREGAEERKEAFQQKKAEEQQAELERIRRLPPEEQQKWMEKQQKIRQRRSMKTKTLRV